MPAEAAGTMDAVGQEPRRPLLAFPGLGAISGAARVAFGMEISPGGGIDVPGVPSLVPSLFPVSRQSFHRVPVFSVSASRAMSTVSCIPSLHGGTLGTVGTGWLQRYLGVRRSGTDG